MKETNDIKGELRATHTMRLLENAKHETHIALGPIGVFMRVTLAIIFMYLIVISYQMLGAIGLVFISVLFLISLFLPALYRVFTKKRDTRKEGDSLGQESSL